MPNARICTLVASVAVFLALATEPGLAHHSFAAAFDANLPVSLTGVVTKVDWRNPHIWIYIDATDDDGRVTHWEVEGGAPNSLLRSGWRQDAVKVGDRITVDGFRAYRKENAVSMQSVAGADGKKVLFGLSERAF